MRKPEDEMALIKTKDGGSAWVLASEPFWWELEEEAQRKAAERSGSRRSSLDARRGRWWS